MRSTGFRGGGWEELNFGGGGVHVNATPLQEGRVCVCVFSNKFRREGATGVCVCVCVCVSARVCVFRINLQERGRRGWASGLQN